MQGSHRNLTLQRVGRAPAAGLLMGLALGGMVQAQPQPQAADCPAQADDAARLAC